MTSFTTVEWWAAHFTGAELRRIRRLAVAEAANDAVRTWDRSSPGWRAAPVRALYGPVFADGTALPDVAAIGPPGGPHVPVPSADLPALVRALRDQGVTVVERGGPGRRRVGAAVA